MLTPLLPLLLVLVLLLLLLLLFEVMEPCCCPTAEGGAAEASPLMLSSSMSASSTSMSRARASERPSSKNLSLSSSSTASSTYSSEAVRASAHVGGQAGAARRGAVGRWCACVRQVRREAMRGTLACARPLQIFKFVSENARNNPHIVPQGALLPRTPASLSSLTSSWVAEMSGMPRFFTWACARPSEWERSDQP